VTTFIAVFLHLAYFTLKMEASSSSKTSVFTCKNIYGQGPPTHLSKEYWRLLPTRDKAAGA
jgi:hypothetical protein